MTNRQYSYQYETSPRKLKPEYDKPKKNTKQKNLKKKLQKSSKKVSKSVNKTDKQNNQKQDDIKSVNILNSRTKMFIFFKCVILFAIMFLMIFRDSKISESYSQIQALKDEITEIQKENDQLEINIQNSVNLNHIEQAAKELLGMQKLSNKQTVYISLSKKDYVEPRTEEIIIEEKKSSWDNFIEKIKNVF